MESPFRFIISCHSETLLQLSFRVDIKLLLHDSARFLDLCVSWKLVHLYSIGLCQKCLFTPDYFSSVTGTLFHNAIKLDSIDSLIGYFRSDVVMMCLVGLSA